MRFLGAAALALMLAFAGCSGATEEGRPSDQEVEDAVRTAVAESLPTTTPTQGPDTDATVEAMVSATLAAIPPSPTPAHTPRAAPTSTPVPTHTPTPSPTPTPTATPTPTPTPFPTPTPRPAPILEFGEAILVWDIVEELFCFGQCSQAQVGFRLSGIHTDVSVEVTFVNPIQTGQFEYGILLNKSIDVQVSSGRIWRAFRREKGVSGSGEETTVVVPLSRGKLDGPLNTEPGGENHLQLAAVGEEACLFVNGEFVSCIYNRGYAGVDNIYLASQHGDAHYKGLVIRPILGSGDTP